MRRLIVLITLGTAGIVVPAGPAAATHTGCEHSRTQQAHASVPHHNEGNHHAHQSIPYCPPDDAPRHAQ